MINKDTTLCISLAARPSPFGTRFHNFLYRELGLNFAYKAVAPTGLSDAIRGIRGLGIRGSAVSMPYKTEVIQFLDELTPDAEAIGAVNTIVNTAGRLVGCNTDVIALRRMFAALGRKPASVTVLGSGGIARAILRGLEDAGFPPGTLASRNAAAGQALARPYGYRWSDRAVPAELLVNATPIGMAPDVDSTPFDAATLERAAVVMDAVAHPLETRLIREARALGKTVLTGAELVCLQAVEQFRLYTGVTPPAELVARAAAFARAG